ncbi:MAG: asparagine--tRNA ligase [Thermoproteota archaeon]
MLVSFIFLKVGEDNSVNLNMKLGTEREVQECKISDLGKFIGRRVRIHGWLYVKNTIGKISFLRIRDSSGLVQVVVRKEKVGEEVFEQMDKLKRESSLIIEGIVKKDERAPSGVELGAESLIIQSPSLEDYPLRKDLSPNLVWKYRHLFIRGRIMSTILKLRSSLSNMLRNWLIEHGFFEVDAPSIVTAATEGGAKMFEVEYFGKKAFLTQSSQFYLEGAIFSLGKVFCFQPSFRAEESKTRRHLSEYWHLEVEVSNMSFQQLLDLEENMLTSVVKEFYEKYMDDIKRFNPEFRPFEKPFRRITYTHAIELLKDNGLDIEWGRDLGVREEKMIATIFGQPVFITHYPRQVRAFYHMPSPENPSVVLSADLIVWPYGEITGGGQRIDDYKMLLERIVESGYNPDDYSWYLDLRKYGSVPHSGFGLGFERLLAHILNLPSIRYAIPYPRTQTIVYP